MQLLKLNDRQRNSLFQTAFFSLVFMKSAGFDSSDKIYLYISIFALFLLFIKNLGTFFVKKEILIIFILLAISVYSAFKVNSYTFLFSLIIVLSSKNIDTEIILKKISFVMLAGIIFDLFLYIFKIKIGGLKPVYDVNSNFVGYYYGYGYLSPNLLSSTVTIFYICFSYRVFSKKLPLKMEISIIVLSLLLSFAIFSLTHCRTAFIILILYNSFLFLNIYHKNRMQRFVFFLSILFTIFSFALLFFYNGDIDFFNMADLLLSRRLSNAYLLISKHGISLFGNTNSFVDNMYAKITIHYGLLALLAFSYHCFRIYQKQKQNYLFLISFSIFLIYGIFEQFPLNVVMCPFFLQYTMNDEKV